MAIICLPGKRFRYLVNESQLESKEAIDRWRKILTGKSEDETSESQKSSSESNDE